MGVRRIMIHGLILRYGVHLICCCCCLPGDTCSRIVRVANDHDRADTVMHAIITPRASPSRPCARRQIGGWSPVGAVEHGGGAHVEEDDGVAGPEVVLHGPADGLGGLVGEVDGDADAALRGGVGGAGERGEEVARGGGLDRGRLRRREAHRR